MGKFNRIPATLRGIASDTTGNAGIAFGFTVLPILMTMGAAVDFRLASQVKSSMQSATDAAIIAAMASRNLSTDERILRATELYKNNTSTTPLAAASTSTVTIGADVGTIVAKVDMPTSVLRVVGINTLPIQAKSTARTYPKKIELSLMTDVTGSMSEFVSGAAKINGLKLAARDLLDIILPDGAPAGSSRVALVPFANYVNAGPYAADVTNTPATKPSGELLITCVTERTGTFAGTDVAPGSSAWIGSTRNYSMTGECKRSGSSTPLPAVMPLTDDKQSLLSTIESFTPAGSTAGHLGTAWAWYAISPQWNSVWSLSTPIAGNNDIGTMKVAVLMTDGEYNTQYSTTDSKTQALALCNGMKAAGITVYTVGFGLGTSNAADIAAMDTLAKCASGKDFFFTAYDGEALRQVFTFIGGKVNAINAVLTD